MLLAIDPGADSGWAVFFHSMLIACGLGNEPKPLPDRFDTIAVEHPVIYPHGRTKNPNDIVKLAVNAGEWAGRFRARVSEVRYIEPRTWKGTIDGDLCNARVLERLDDTERMIVDDATRDQRIPAKKSHNMLDAIGIGLFVSKRLR